MVRIAYYIIISLLTLFSLLPLRVHYIFSDIIAFILGRVVKYRYATIVTNLSRSFPELTYDEIKETAHLFYRHLSDVIVESIWSFTASADKIGRQVMIEGREDLEKALDKKRNVIVMLGHIGNWEIFTGLPDLRSHYGINIDNKNFVYIYKPPTSRLADMVINKIRSRHCACSTVDMHSIIRRIAGKRRGEEVYFFICDQNPESSRSKFVTTFLNQKTYMIEGPEMIAAKMGMPVMYVSIIREGRRKNRARFKLISEDASQCERGYITSEFSRLLEQDIRNYKHTWLWSHKKWKRIIL